MNRNILSFTALFLLVGISSCKKDGTDTKIIPDTDCIITSFTLDGDDDEKNDIIYVDDLITTFTSASNEIKLFYNSDKLLTHRYRYDENNQLSNVDTLFYDASKRLTSKVFYAIDGSGKRVFLAKEWYEYNTSNQIKTIKDSTIYIFDRIGISAFEYVNNRISKEIYSTYENGKFTGMSEFTYSYTTIKNSFYNALNQPEIVFIGNILHVDNFINTDLLVSKVVIKELDEDDEIIDTYTTNFTYTFDNDNLKSVTVDGEKLLDFEYKCD